MLDYGSLSNQELTDISQTALREIERRRNETELPEHIDRLATLYHQAIGRVDGDPWVQPTGAHDAYRKDATVTHNDKVWRSTTSANVWEPGVSGWREFTEDDEAIAGWLQPTGEHDAYQTGDRVLFEGDVYESVIDGNIWSPFVHPQGWKKVEEPVEDEPEVEEPGDDEETPEPGGGDEEEPTEPVEPEEPGDDETEEPGDGEGEPGVEEPVEDEPVPDFVQPTGGHDAYKKGDLMTFEGAVYESIIDGNVWSPTDNPAGWKLIADDDSGESE